MTPTPPATVPNAPVRNWTAVAAVLVTMTAWASAFVVIRWVGEDFDAGALSLGRLVIGSLTLGAFVLARSAWVRPRGREWLLLVVCGLAWFGVYNVALNAAGQRIDAGTMAMLVNVGPILIALLAGVVLGEGFPKWLLIGAGIAFSGVVLIGVSTRQADGADGLGVLLALLAAVTYAIGVVTQKLVLRRLSGLLVTWLACTIGALACLPFLPRLVGDLGAAGLGPIAGMVYLGLVPTALAFSTWAYALTRMDAGRLGVTSYLVPPLTIVMGLVFLGELPALLAVAGGLVCLAGVGISRRRDRQAVPVSR